MLPPIAAFLNAPRTRAIAGEFLRFAVVGAIATAVHYAILILLVELAQAPVVASTSLGFVAGAVVSYTLNRRLTFRHKPKFAAGFAKFFAAGSVGLALNALIVWALIRLGAPYMLAQVVATGLVLIFNFATARLIVFREAARR